MCILFIHTSLRLNINIAIDDKFKLEKIYKIESLIEQEKPKQIKYIDDTDNDINQTPSRVCIHFVCLLD